MGQQQQTTSQGVTRLLLFVPGSTSTGAALRITTIAGSNCRLKCPRQVAVQATTRREWEEGSGAAWSQHHAAAAEGHNLSRHSLSWQSHVTFQLAIRYGQPNFRQFVVDRKVAYCVVHHAPARPISMWQLPCKACLSESGRPCCRQLAAARTASMRCLLGRLQPLAWQACDK